MKPDSAPARLDAIERAHLKEPGDASHRMYRYAPHARFAGLLRRYWIPVWSVPPGQESRQLVLQYPICLLVVALDYARFYGVTTGLSTTTLTGEGWAVGVMCAPAAGALVAGGPVAMAGDPHPEDAHRAAMAAYDDVLVRYLPVDAEGELVNAVVTFVEEDSGVVRVAQVCERFGLTERSLQRLLHRRLGLTPKWLIQRRRLQEAAERLRTGDGSLAETAAVLGYADQAHFARDFSRVTAMTPGRFAARHRG